MITTRPSRPATPDWLVQTEVGLCPCGCIGKRKKGGFVEKTLNGIRLHAMGGQFSNDPLLVFRKDRRHVTHIVSIAEGLGPALETKIT